jgi:site-specific recombinase XerC
VTRAHVLAGRRDLERRALSGASIRRKLAALSSLFEALCEANAIQGNPVDGVKRSKMASSEGKTPAIGDYQACALLQVADPATFSGSTSSAAICVRGTNKRRRVT